MSQPEDFGQDFIVSELLSELKAENARKDNQIRQLHKSFVITILATFVTVLIVVGGFIWYLNQYDFIDEVTTTTSAEGVYAVVDSDGNIIGQDLTADQIEQLMEGINNGESNEDENRDTR